MVSVKENARYIFDKFQKEVNQNFKVSTIDIKNITIFLENENSKGHQIYVNGKCYIDVSMNVLKRFNIKDFSNFNCEDYKKMKFEHLKELKEERKRRTNENEY